jgi:N-acyl homoserine lactone hydrolase
MKKFALLVFIWVLFLAFGAMIFAEEKKTPVKESRTELKIKALHIGDVLSDWSFSLQNFNPGRKRFVPINAFLILGAEKPILVDSGIKPLKMDPQREKRLKFFESPEQDLIRLLREEGFEPANIGYIIHTHLDIDHTGKSPLFPNAKIIIQRKELAYHAAGYRGIRGNPDIPWFINNRQVEFIDGDVEVFPGVKCVLAIGHTGGHQHIEVQTNGGKAILCGDTVNDIPMQLEDRIPGVIWPPTASVNEEIYLRELYKLKKELQRGSLILPSHAYEVFDRYKLGKKLSDKSRDYEGLPSMDWPPKK